MATSIEHLRIYTTARAAEDAIYELVKQFPAEQFYGLGNDLRRSSAGVSHFIMEAHCVYSYRLKLDALDDARRQGEITKHHLTTAKEFGASDELIEEYTSILKQSWGLTKWLRAKLYERNQAAEVSAKEEIVASTT